MKKITILGSTGSVGSNALKVVREHPKKFDVKYLTANKNSKLIVDQCREFKPDAVVINNVKTAEIVYKELLNDGIKVLSGRNNIIKISKDKDIDLVLNALVGTPGMEPTLAAISSGINVALSNKESLVMAGGIIKKAMEKTGALLYPVDSEHSAIWQCLVGENIKDINKIILTGSGGPFLNRDINTFSKITVGEALDHPNWSMGNKITIDSATMMNKGFEVIEAYWLFDIDISKIDIIIHPESVIHSMVEFIDGSVKSQMGIPDMKIPIQYALTYPKHEHSDWEKLDLVKYKTLSFKKPDFNKFPSIKLAYKALEELGSSPSILNLSNDYAVYAFLDGKINFLDIYKINKSAMDNHQWLENPTIDDLKSYEEWVIKYINRFL